MLLRLSSFCLSRCLTLHVSALSSSLACLSSWFNCLSSSSPSALSLSLCHGCLLHSPPLSLTPVLLLSLHSLYPMPHSCQTIFLPSSFSLAAKWPACPAFASLVIFFFHYVNDLWQCLRWVLLSEVMVTRPCFFWQVNKQSDHIIVQALS